jgi:hypothetical protein
MLTITMRKKYLYYRQSNGKEEWKEHHLEPSHKEIKDEPRNKATREMQPPLAENGEQTAIKWEESQSSCRESHLYKVQD